VRDSIPHKSPAPPDFYTTARAAAARPRPPCGREGVIRKSFFGTFSVSKGDSVPLRRSALLLYFFHNKALNDIAFLDIIVVLDAHAALIRGCNFLHIVLEALEGIQVALVEYDAVTDYALR